MTEEAPEARHPAETAHRGDGPFLTKVGRARRAGIGENPKRRPRASTRGCAHPPTVSVRVTTVGSASSNGAGMVSLGRARWLSPGARQAVRAVLDADADRHFLPTSREGQTHLHPLGRGPVVSQPEAGALLGRPRGQVERRAVQGGPDELARGADVQVQVGAPRGEVARKRRVRCPPAVRSSRTATSGGGSAPPGPAPSRPA